MIKRILLGLAAIALMVISVTMFVNRANAPTLHVIHTTTPTKPKPTFDKTALSNTDPKSLWVVVNKQHPLQPVDYVPGDLIVPDVPLRVPGNESMKIRSVVVSDMEALFTAAKAAGSPLMLSSGYRSYSYQVSLYGTYVSERGRAVADTFSARPGYSEHQTGLAFDVEPLDQTCDVDQCFADTTAGKWIAAHAYEYGFILRYPADKVDITGYTYEPWHLRYVGKQLALELHNEHVETLEEFFGITGSTSYDKP